MSDNGARRSIIGIGQVGIGNGADELHFEFIDNEKRRLKFATPFSFMGKIVFALQGLFNSAVQENAKRPGFDPSRHAIPFRATDFRVGLTATPDKETVVLLQMTTDKGLTLSLPLSIGQAIQLGQSLIQKASSGPPQNRSQH
jgi:hypothetical protein